MSKKMTKKQKLAVAVAKDVIAQIKCRKYNPGHCYADLTMKRGKNRNDLKLTKGASLQKELSKVKECRVCAIGAAFVSLVRIDNKFTVDIYSLRPGNLSNSPSVDDCAMRNRLTDVFDGETVELLEDCHEGGITSEFEEIEDDSERMIAIMENIIKNNGKFKPNLDVPEEEDDEDYLFDDDKFDDDED